MSTASPPVKPQTFPGFVVSPAELAQALRAGPKPPVHPRIIPLSASWFLPNDTRNGIDDFVSSHIPTSVFFNLDAIADNTSVYPHMLPSASTFSQAMTSLGIQRNDTIVVYDSSETGIFSAPRVAWTLKAFRHPTVHILNNYKEWVRAGFPVTSGPMKNEDRKSKEVYPEVEVEPEYVATFEEIVRLAQGEEKGQVQIVDARPTGRFRGVDPEPREGLSSGHVPGAINLPFFELLDESKKLKDPAALKEVLLAKGINPDPNVRKVLMCGTGVTACIVDAAIELAGIGGKRKVYDGSWTEWASRAKDSEKLIVKDN
ncbi:Rhodanese-like protein [Ascobolus immersus RN42]|uniref:Rhodanese-like protein n=1 Tax=Ascobolus immersus RN42 TaxID=1160509 RepID=A0A3N4I9G2_ASCIM|nr:Rhodanese-like protein [Ascobolus immersus RN42]